MLSRKLLAQAVPVSILALVLSACGPLGGDDQDDPARRAAEVLATGLASGDLSAVPFLEPGGPEAFAELWKPLRGSATEVVVEQMALAEDEATATLDWQVEVAGILWSHSTEATLRQVGGAWKVAWEPSILEASLLPGETLVVTGIKAPRGDILGAGDEPLVEPRAVVRFGVDKAQAGAGAARAARQLAALLEIDPASLAKQVGAAGPRAFVPALVLRRSEVSSTLLARVASIQGARSISDRLPLAPTKEFAAALLGTVGPATAELITASKGRLRAGDDAGLSGLQARYDEQLSGTRGLKISARPATGGESRVLFTAEPVAGEVLRLTLDAALQSQAQRLLRRYGPASALVAIRPSTGEILTAASGPGSEGYNTATFGQYAPGSTFKVVSALALLRAGLTPTTRVSCPATVTVNGKRFKNYSDYPGNRLGRITLRQALANSCNTAFISERDKITGSALADAAAALGFGVDRDLGFPAYFGQVPAPKGETEAAADLIGQGKILASPMAMAAVIASVVKGSTVVPDLIRDGEPAPSGPSGPAVPLTGDEATALRTLLRAVVQEGSGSFLQSLGSPGVLAKTGTAEYGDATRTHAWMIGAQGDLAVAVFVETGESGSQTAGPVLEEFLRTAR